jgi:hypothetical protein
MQQEFRLRDVFNSAAVEQLAHSIERAWPAFDGKGFATTISSQLQALSFGGRNALIRDMLRAYLPQEFPEAVQILLDALGPEIPHCEVTGFDGFIVMPQNDFVAAYGLSHLDLSLRALHELTKRFTAEGAIRAFLQAYPEQTLARLTEWAADPNCHVRRLVSEGTRPRLPLAPRLPAFITNPRPILALLERLKADPVLMCAVRSPTISMTLPRTTQTWWSRRSPVGSRPPIQARSGSSATPPARCSSRATLARWHCWATPRPASA